MAALGDPASALSLAEEEGSGVEGGGQTAA